MPTIAALSSDALEAEPLDGEPESDSALEGEVEVLTRTSEPPLERAVELAGPLRVGREPLREAARSPPPREGDGREEQPE